VRDVPLSPSSLHGLRRPGNDCLSPIYRCSLSRDAKSSLFSFSVPEINARNPIDIKPPIGFSILPYAKTFSFSVCLFICAFLCFLKMLSLLPGCVPTTKEHFVSERRRERGRKVKKRESTRSSENEREKERKKSVGREQS